MPIARHCKVCGHCTASTGVDMAKYEDEDSSAWDRPPLPDGVVPDNVRCINNLGHVDWWFTNDGAWQWWDERVREWKPSLYGPC